MDEQPTPEDALQFWFGAPATTAEELGPKMRRWFQGGPAMDAEVERRFGAATKDATAGKLDSWLSHPKGWLSLILVLDQFTRNVFRDMPSMYDGDPRAQALAMEGLDSGRTHTLPIEERHFAVLPLAHSEILAHQERGVAEVALIVEAEPPALRMFYEMGIEQTRKYHGVIARFGRFPHRNAILGRTSTPEEVEFLRDWALKQPPSQGEKLMGKRA